MVTPNDDGMKPPDVRDLNALVSRICDKCRGPLLKRRAADDHAEDDPNFDFENWQTPDPVDLDHFAKRRRAYRAEWEMKVLPGRGQVLIATFTMPYPRDAPMPGNTRGEGARRSIIAFCAAALKSVMKTQGNA